jgi:hypothetical protein
MRIFEQLESEVRSYIRSFPVSFDVAEGSFLYDEQGKRYIDFFSGAGTLNYGHNNPSINNAIIEYLKRNGIVHGLDKATTAKKHFLQKFLDTILAPRNLHYKVQFTGPTGTNAVETALKLAARSMSNALAAENTRRYLYPSRTGQMTGIFRCPDPVAYQRHASAGTVWMTGNSDNTRQMVSCCSAMSSRGKPFRKSVPNCAVFPQTKTSAAWTMSLRNRTAMKSDRYSTCRR